jgi:phage baseplate assembly protein W
MAQQNIGAVARNTSPRSVRVYSDLSLDLTLNPITKDVTILKDVEAVKRSVRNLVNTNHFERPFHPEIGGDVRALLFELVTPLTALQLERKIEEVLVNFEPRCKLNQVVVKDDMDSNGYRVFISFYVLNVPEPVTVETFLERLR